MLHNYKVSLSYCGKQYAGFQLQTKQPNVNTVEGQLIKALTCLVKDFDNLVVSGRTDAGVHAFEQVFNFKTSIPLDFYKFKYSMNQLLPSDILIKGIEEVDDTFNARKSALSREYIYNFTSYDIPLAVSDYVSRVTFDIDDITIPEFSNILLGQHDFIHFRNTGSVTKTTVREVFEANLTKKKFSNLYDLEETGYYYAFHIKANAFLYRMVRNLMGAIFEILKNNERLKDFEQSLTGKTTKFKYTTAPAKGLSLIKVNY